MKKAFSSILNRRQTNADRNKKQEVSQEVENEDFSITNSFVEISHSDRHFLGMPGGPGKSSKQNNNSMISVINQLKEKHKQDQNIQHKNSLFSDITGINETDNKKDDNKQRPESGLLNFERKKPEMRSMSPMRKMLRRKREKVVTKVSSSGSDDDGKDNKHVTNSMIEQAQNLNLVKTQDNKIRFVPFNQMNNQKQKMSGKMDLKKIDSSITNKMIEKKASITSNKSGITSTRGSQISMMDKSKIDSPKLQKQSSIKIGQSSIQMQQEHNKTNPQPYQQLPDRADVTQMDCNMYNLVEILEQAYKYMQIVKNEDVVVCIGYTGSGKSTLFSYLAFGGKQGVVEQTVQHYVKIGLSNKQKLKKRKVIGNSVDNCIFKIGHSECESETFFPSFWKDEKANLLYCDIAGAGESGPHLIRLINHFTLHFLVNKVKSLKILLLITYLQMTDSRGIKVSQIVREAMNLVENDLEKINGYSSIFQPIISSKNITQHTNFNIEFARFDLKLILDKHIFEKLQIEQDSKEQGNSMDNMLFNGNTTNNYLSIQSTADGLGQTQDNTFSNKFSNKLILFDPLETPYISDQGIDQTIKHEELIQIIHKMDCYKRQPQKQQLQLLKSFLTKDEDSKNSKIRSTKYISMSYELEEKLDFMFERLERELKEVRQRHEEYVREKSELMQPLFSEDPKVLAMRKVYDFFLEFNLLCKEQLNSRCTEFFNFISDVELSLENILFYNTQQEHEPNEFQNLLDLLIASNYEQIVPKLIMYYKLIEKLKQELTLVTASRFESVQDFNFRGSVNMSNFQSVGTSKLIQDDMEHPDKYQQLIIVSEAYLLVILDRIVSNQETLHQFAYHLRKVDNESNFFTKIFLVGRVKPILLDLYLSNTWVKSREDNQFQGQFVPSDDVMFSIKHLNSIQDMTIQYVETTKEDQQIYASPIGKNADFFQFVLAEDGFQIMTKSFKGSSKRLDDKLQNQQFLVPKQSNYETMENYLMMKSKKNPNLSVSSDMNSSSENAQKKNKDSTITRWRLVAKQLDDDDAVFFIELAQQGRQNPRLITHGKKSQQIRSESVMSASNAHDKGCLCNKIIVTRKYAMGTEKHERLGLWEILKHDKKQTITDSLSLHDISKPIFKMDASSSVYTSVAAQPKVYEMLLGYTQVIERQIPSYNLNQNFILKLQSKLKCLLDKIFEEGSNNFDQPTEIFIRYLKRGFQFQEVRSCFFNYFSTIVKETRVANKIALFTLQEMIDHHIQKLYENLGYCTLFDLDKFIQASLLIWCKVEQSEENTVKEPDIDDSLTRDKPLLIECIGDSGDEDEDRSGKVDVCAKNRQNFLKMVKQMVPQKIFLNDFLVQARSDIRSFKNHQKKSKRRITVQQSDIEEQSVFMQPVVWIEVIKMYVEKELDQEQSKNKKVNIFQKLMDRVIGKEAQKGKLSKYKLLIRCFHLYLLRFGLPRDVIHQILLSDEHKLKPKETKKLQIYLDMVYYWKGLKNVTSIEVPHRVTKEFNMDFEPINIDLPEKDMNFEKLEESYFEYIFEDQDDVWFKKQKQLKMLPNQEELKKMYRSDDWLRILQMRDHYHEFGLENYIDCESNWKKVFGNNHQKLVNNMLQFNPFKHSDSSLINLLLKEDEQDDESVIQKHISVLNSLLKSFALKQNIKSMTEIEKYKDLVVFVYQVMRVEKTEKNDGTSTFQFLEETLQDFDDIEDGYGLATQIDKLNQLLNYNKVFKLLVHLATMNGLHEMICDSNDFVLRFILYEFDCLVAIHLPELQKHLQELNVSWCSVFGLQWYKRMLSIFILKNFTAQQMQESKACVFQIWDAVIEACAQSDFVPWSLFHQLSLYILALHQQILLNLDNEEEVLNAILQATRSILKADSHELDQIEEYYFSNVEQNNNYEIPVPYWDKKEQDIQTTKDKQQKQNKTTNSESKRKQTTTNNIQPERPFIHISERLASCFQQDRNGNKMDIIGQLSNVRKDLLNLHVKKYQRSNFFQFNFLRTSKPTKNTVDPVDMGALPLQDKEQESIHREIFGNSPMFRPDILSHGPAFNALSAKAKESRKACEMILNQIYEI